MVNSSKQPSGKAKKGQVTVRPDSGSIKACFPRNYFDEGKQIKLGTNISPSSNWEPIAAKLQRRLQIELEDGKLATNDGIFNIGRYQEVLGEYGLRPNLRLVRESSSDDQLPPKPELSLMEIWDMYCEYKKNRDLAVTTYHQEFRGIYYRAIKQALVVAGENNPVGIYNWLLENRNHKTAKEVLSQLSKAYKIAIKQKLAFFDPYEGMAEDIIINRKPKTINQLDEVEEDYDDLDLTKAYTWDEINLILDYVKNSPRVNHWFNYLKFKVLTGCRPGEASGLWWCDIKWQHECIVIQRSYDYRLKIFKPTKNETSRRFPMPKDGELWNLLKSIPQGEPNEIVLKSKNGKPISAHIFNTAWLGREKSQKGIVTELIQQGKLEKYLPPYNTRHAFVNHQINDIGIAPHIVNSWCEHSDKVSKEHYRELDLRTVPGYGESIQQQSELDLLKEQLRKQQELIDQLLKDRKND
ncbi:tyrosine-type recombinase/integrase [Nostocaceae cyanobacterium CENA357]|uniref:Tyrosine-type recombinase/integrase n=1 Tax=Atlanticothrix silvestris CENA357 TaxID=1725252 RepID=A0A8J7L5Z9_9CYAN|nr:site-specific integrase [Atlanticothrix silvestris]MBH8553597.1 tyrosine-type recombinase/integrase [Atlanticothrix silvestris CENA357]